MAFKFPVINPLLHNELRLKIMVALDSLESANFMYLCEITGATRGNLSVQIKLLQEADYLQVDKRGSGPAARSTCCITRKGMEAMLEGVVIQRPDGSKEPLRKKPLN